VGGYKKLPATSSSWTGGVSTERVLNEPATTCAGLFVFHPGEHARGGAYGSGDSHRTTHGRERGVPQPPRGASTTRRRAGGAQADVPALGRTAVAYHRAQEA